MSLSRAAAILMVAAGAACGGPTPAPPDGPTPASLDEFRAEASRVLAETGVPGAGLALVRADGVEWAGGIGHADRDHGTPVTADTHFRVGSISKTFVAIALVQQYEDDTLDLDASVSELVPDVAIDNPWRATNPVTVLHLLQHTAGFDDMHFTEMYNVADRPDLPLVDVLKRSPASRRVRWRPGTRMSYSNPGYAVAGHVLETVTGRPYEDVIRDRIFSPLGMTTSSFTVTDDDRRLMASGYDAPTGPPVPLSHIYLRPAGNLHSSSRELATFVRMLLNWGETDDQLVVDPEYLSNMERPRSSIAAKAGLIYGYGSGIASRTLAGFPVLGHNGGIEGFTTAYGYSAARDVGWVVLLNATYAPEAVDRISALAVRYLKREVDPPATPEFQVAPGMLETVAGYYHPEGSRSQIFSAIDWMRGGTRVRAEGNHLIGHDVTGRQQRLIPVSNSLFRRDVDVTPSVVFTKDEDGRSLMLADGFHGVRLARWRVEVIRVPVLLAVTVLCTLPVAWLLWLVRARRAWPRGFWALKVSLLAVGLALLALAAILGAPQREWGAMNTYTRLTFIGSWALPLASLCALALVFDAGRRGARPWFLAYAAGAAGSGLVLSGYLAASGLVGFRPWAY